MASTVIFLNKSKTSELKHQQWPGGGSLKKENLNILGNLKRDC